MNDFDNEILPTDPDEGEEITERVAGRETYEWVRSLVGAVLVITLLFTFVVRLMGVDGHSMVPTLQDGDRLIVVSGWLCGDYKYGDIVIAYKESFDAEPIVKRVIATEGQTVDIDFTLGRVFVDGELLELGRPVRRVYVRRGEAPTVLLRHKCESFYEHAAKVFF